MLRLIASAAAGLATAGITMTVAFWLAITVVPNRTAEGHGLMPIGQAAVAMLSGGLLGVVAGWRTHRRLGR